MPMRSGSTQGCVSSQATALTASSIEIATDFTIGGAVEQAAEEIRIDRNVRLAQLTGANRIAIAGQLLALEDIDQLELHVELAG